MDTKAVTASNLSNSIVGLTASSSWEAFHAVDAQVQRMESSLWAGDYRRLNQALVVAADRIRGYSCEGLVQ